jgi:uncharacterized protein
MGLIRFLFLLLIAGVLWFMAKNYMRKVNMQEQRLRERKEQERLSRGRIVRCKQCDVHLPEQDAVREGDDWFCSQAHRQAWLAASSNKS